MIDAFDVTWREDGTATVLGRVTARDGSGAATGVNGEGNWIQQADLSSITLSVFDESSADPDTATATATLTVSSVIQDTPVSTNVIWTRDTTGYNFIYDVTSTYFATGGHVYRLEFKFTTTGSAVLWGVYRGRALPLRTS